MRKYKLIPCLAIAALTLLIVEPVNAQNVNRAWSEEYFNGWWCYDGTAQFNPSYKIPKNPGYSLKSGKYVKQSYVNYTRKKNGEDKSIIGGRSYSRCATSKTNAVYKATATAKDSLNLFTNKTHFWYGWYYF